MISIASKMIIRNNLISKLKNNDLKKIINISIRTNNDNYINIIQKRYLSTTFKSNIEINNSKIEMSPSKLTKGDNNVVKISQCGPLDEEDDELEELEDMFIMGPAGMEWNGPTRGGMNYYIYYIQLNI